jgi:2-polyprenyl-6-methoxyphenol hydroxylase-like FAD-dependent oxidoreductase
MKCACRQFPKGAAVCVRSWRGERLSRLDTQELKRRLGDVMVVLHRAELLAVLRDALRDTRLLLASRCVGFSQDGERVKALLVDGSDVEGDLLIGADGLYSVIRSQLFGSDKPRYAGYTGWRGITAFAHNRLTPGISLGRGAQFGQVPLKGGEQVYWFATKKLPEGESEMPGGRRPTLLTLFGKWHAPIADIIRSTDEEAIIRTDIYDRPPLRRWGEGRVTLLGDAAHAMTPDLGQGACQALEDAVTLARCLKGRSDPTFALRSYEARRIPRTNGVARASRLVGKIYQWENPLACYLRDRFFKSQFYASLQLRGLQRLANSSVESMEKGTLH